MVTALVDGSVVLGMNSSQLELAVELLILGGLVVGAAFLALVEGGVIPRPKGGRR